MSYVLDLGYKIRMSSLSLTKRMSRGYGTGDEETWHDVASHMRLLYFSCLI